jgi:hypothetical protein
MSKSSIVDEIQTFTPAVITVHKGGEELPGPPDPSFGPAGHVDVTYGPDTVRTYVGSVLLTSTALSSGGGSVLPVTNLGINGTAFSYGSGTRPFSNMLYGDTWRMSGGGNPLANLPAGHTNANGWVTSLPGTYTTVERSISIPITSGSFEIIYTGTGTITVLGTQVSNVDTSVPGKTTFTYASNYSDANWFADLGQTTIQYVLNTGDPIQNIDIREVGASKSTTFDLPYQNAVAGYNTWRPNNGFQVGCGVDTGISKTPPTITWANRNQPGFADYTTNDGVPVELLVAFANATNSNLWVMMPWGADDTYISNFAAYVRDNLKAGLTVYVELDVEIWNFGFAATLQAKAEGLSEGLGNLTAGLTIASITFSGTTATVTTMTPHGMSVTAGGNNVSINVTGASPAAYNAGWTDITSVPSTTTFTYTMASTPATNATTVGSYQSQTGTLALQRRYAEKAAHVLGLWTTAFSSPTNQMSRLVRVAAFQHFGDPASILSSITWNSNALKNVMDAYSTAPYFAFFNSDDTGQTLDTLMTTTLPAIIDTMNTSTAAHKANADSLGVRYIAYEGGQHVVLTDTTRARSIQTDPRMYDLYGKFLWGWIIYGGGDLMVLTNLGGPITSFGSWGLVEWIGQSVSKTTTPKQQLVNDWRNGVRLPQPLSGSLSSAANSANGFLVGTVKGFFPTGSTLSIQSTGPTNGSALTISSSGAVTVADSTKNPASGTYNVTVRESNPAFPAGYRDTVLSWAVSVALNNTHAYRYYRLQVDAPQTSNGDVWVTNMEIHAIPGGPDTAAGVVTATSLDHEGSNVPSNAFDNAPSTWSSASNPTWLQADYGSSSANWVAANEFLLKVPNSVTGPVNFRFQGSDDALAWTDLKAISGRTNAAAETSWGAATSQTFTV